jgi:hypothetical protein
MEITQEHRLNAQVIERAWDDAQFKNELMVNPVSTMEKFTGHKINLPDGKKLMVIDQTDESTVYFNIPKKLNVDDLELTVEQLEMVAGGLTPTVIIACIALGIELYAVTK